MHVISWKRIKEFIDAGHADADKPLRNWRAMVRGARYANPSEMKRAFPSASIVKGPRTVFNIGGNKYRLVVDMKYDKRCIYVRGVFTHEEYDRVDVTKV